ncbi:MAG: NUDIX hydrolase [Planctomycetes bacterium]|nr:NUDIX hydrolase [Planctomycetota bacterium]
MVQKIPEPKFCILCGAALHEGTPPNDHRPRHICSACGFIHYRQPKIAAGVVVEHDGGVVLIRRSVEPRRGFWSFPCGFMEIDETLEEAAVRETREECGLRVELQGHLATYSYVQSWHGGSIVVAVYRGRSAGGMLQAGDDAMEARVVRPDEIPWPDLAFKSTHAALTDWLQARAH